MLVVASVVTSQGVRNKFILRVTPSDVSEAKKVRIVTPACNSNSEIRCQILYNYSLTDFITFALTFTIYKTFFQKLHQNFLAPNLQRSPTQT